MLVKPLWPRERRRRYQEMLFKEPLSILGTHAVRALAAHAEVVGAQATRLDMRCDGVTLYRPYGLQLGKRQ